MNYEENRSRKERKALIRLLERMFITVKDALYTMEFDDDSVNLVIYRKEKKYKYHVRIDVTPYRAYKDSKIDIDTNERVESDGTDGN